MDVSHFTTKIQGGAGIAAQRLHNALLNKGVLSNFYYREGEGEILCGEIDKRYSSFLWRNLNSIIINRQWKRTENSRGLFTSPKWFYKTRLAEFGSLPQVVNLHWISRWIDQPGFFASIPNDLPVVWSLHDMNPITGGCHHALECNRFTSQCNFCPHLKHSGLHDEAWKNFKIKRTSYRKLNLHVVGNSSWMTDQAQKSALMGAAKSFQTIHPGIDTEVYAPISQASARESLRIEQDEFVLAFASAEISDQNKGLAVLIEAIRALADKYTITLIVFGSGELPQIAGNIRVVHLGRISSPVLQCVAYSSADLFVMPSRVESFGLAALEAMACQLPVVAFRTGGLPDLIEHRQTGLLVNEVGDPMAVHNALLWMREHPKERVHMGMSGRQRIEQHFSSELMAQRYINIYSEL